LSEKKRKGSVSEDRSKRKVSRVRKRRRTFREVVVVHRENGVVELCEEVQNLLRRGLKFLE